jgi:trehalose 6-phosphate synthase
MNLVAKEYVAAQSSENPGVLVLSRFAGAAAELDSALLVNPYDSEATAGTIKRALDMPLEERKERWTAMMATVESNTVDRWCETFLAALGGAGEPMAEARAPVGQEAPAVPISTGASQGSADPNGHRPLSPSGYRTSH